MVFNIIIFFAFTAMLSWGIGDFFIQRSIKKVGSIESLAWIGIIGSVGLFPFIIKDLPFLQNPINLLLIVGLGIISFVSAMFDFKALKAGKLSVVDVVMEAELPITIALSFIFLKEVLSTKQSIVILFILLGIILTAIRSFSHFKSRIEKGVVLAFIAAIFFGILNVSLGFSSKLISPLMVIWGSWVVYTVITLAVIAYKKGFKKFVVHGSENKKLILTTGIVDTVAWVFYALALAKAEVSIVTAITESYPAIALFLGVWINKEKILLHQYAGAIIAIVCSVLLSMTI
jgi:drug/metabolite transporter (DMT)-like permease